MKNFKINWTGNSIKYNSKEKKIVLNAMEKAEPFTQGQHLLNFEKSLVEYTWKKRKFARFNHDCKKD